MQDRQLYEQILGIPAPWFVERVELDGEEGVVSVYLAHHESATWSCAECGRPCPLHDHGSPRTWRHLDTCPYQTHLRAATPRTCCPEHGVRAVRLPWAEPHSRFTVLFERLALDWLQAASQKAVAHRLELSWDEVLREQGDKRLIGTKHDWLRNPNNFPAEAWQAFTELRRSNLKTARAWAWKEQGMILWDLDQEGPARQHFSWWYRWATHSRLKPMIEKAKMLNKRLPNILTYFQHKITNAASESLNAKIQWVKYTARGFRNFDNFVTAIYFHCGALDLSHSPT